MLKQWQINEIKKRAQARGLSEEQVSTSLAQFNQRATSQQLTPPAGVQPGTQPGAQSFSPNTQGGSELTQPQGTFVGNFFKSLYRPFQMVGESVLEAGRVATTPGMVKSALGQELTPQELESVTSYKPKYIEEKDLTRGGLLKRGAQQTAGVLSYAVPFGKGATLAERVLLPGAASGGLFAASQEGATPGSVATGAATGAISAGVLDKAGQAISPAAQKVGQKLTKAGEKFGITAYVKSIGSKPLAREGGNSLLKRMKNLGINPGSADEVLTQADDLIVENSGKILKTSSQIDEKIPVSKLTGFLKNKIKQAKSIVTKKPLQDVLNVIETDVGAKTTLTPAEYYVLKTEYGSLGSWNSLSSAVEKKQAEAWREVYVLMNDTLDNILKKGGFDEFRAINETVHTAMQARQYAARVGNVAPSKSTLGLLDMVAGAGGFAAGGPAGAVAPMATRRALETPTASKLVGKGLEKAGEALAKTPGLNAPSAALKAGAIGATAAVGAKPEEVSATQQTTPTTTPPTTTPTTPPAVPGAPTSPQPQLFGGKSKRDLLLEALSQGASKSDLEEISGIYDLVAAETPRVSEETRGVANDLRAEYFKRTQENNYLDILNSYNKVANTTDTPAGDVSLIFAYMKMLDPGSVVREGEFATAENTAGVPEQVRKIYNKVIKGKRLSANQRQAYVAEANAVFAQYKQSQSQIDNLYRQLSQQYGIDPELVGIGIYGQQQ